MSTRSSNIMMRRQAYPTTPAETSRARAHSDLYTDSSARASRVCTPTAGPSHSARLARPDVLRSHPAGPRSLLTPTSTRSKPHGTDIPSTRSSAIPVASNSSRDPCQIRGPASHQGRPPTNLQRPQISQSSKPVSRNLAPSPQRQTGAVAKETNKSRLATPLRRLAATAQNLCLPKGKTTTPIKCAAEARVSASSTGTIRPSAPPKMPPKDGPAPSSKPSRCAGPRAPTRASGVAQKATTPHRWSAPVPQGPVDNADAFATHSHMILRGQRASEPAPLAAAGLQQQGQEYKPRRATAPDLATNAHSASRQAEHEHPKVSAASPHEAETFHAPRIPPMELTRRPAICSRRARQPPARRSSRTSSRSRPTLCSRASSRSMYSQRSYLAPLALSRLASACDSIVISPDMWNPPPMPDVLPPGCEMEDLLPPHLRATLEGARAQLRDLLELPTVPSVEASCAPPFPLEEPPSLNLHEHVALARAALRMACGEEAFVYDYDYDAETP